MQVNNTHGWHGARKLVRTNEQEKQKLLQKAKQRQQQQAMKRQQQNSSGGLRPTLSAIRPHTGAMTVVPMKKAAASTPT